MRMTPLEFLSPLYISQFPTINNVNAANVQTYVVETILTLFNVGPQNLI